MKTLGKVWAIIRKDMALEWRSRESLSSMFIFALIVILVFSFSFQQGRDTVMQVAPGVLWVAFTFAGMLGLSRSFIREKDQGCLDGLLLCPVDRAVIYFGKMISNVLFISVCEVFILPIYFALFNLPFRLALLAIILLGTLGFSAVGTLFSAMSVHLRAREVMLPVLLFPIVMPALISAVQLTGGILVQQPWEEMIHWLRLLVGFDVIFLTICYMVFDYVMEE